MRQPLALADERGLSVDETKDRLNRRVRADIQKPLMSADDHGPEPCELMPREPRCMAPRTWDTGTDIQKVGAFASTRWRRTHRVANVANRAISGVCSR